MDEESQEWINNVVQTLDIERFLKLITTYIDNELVLDYTRQVLAKEKPSKEWSDERQTLLGIMKSLLTKNYHLPIVQAEEGKTAAQKPCLEYLTSKKMTWQEYYKSNPYGFVFMEKQDQSKAICISFKELDTILKMPPITLEGDVLTKKSVTQLVKISNDLVDWYFFKKTILNLLSENVGGIALVIPALTALVSSPLEDPDAKTIYGIQLVPTTFTPLTFSDIAQKAPTLENKLKTMTYDFNIRHLDTKGKRILMEKEYNFTTKDGVKSQIDQVAFLPRSFLYKRSKF